jgi:hypothetical protein
MVRRDKISVTSVTSVVNSVFMKHEEFTGQIIAAAMTILNEHKPGLDEKLHENALVNELKESKLTWKRVVRGQPE